MTGQKYTTKSNKAVSKSPLITQFSLGMFEIDVDHTCETTESLATGVACSLWFQVALFVNWESESSETNLRHAHKLQRTDRGDFIEYKYVCLLIYIHVYIYIHDSIPKFRKSQGC